jgi:hypothetical protein
MRNASKKIVAILALFVPFAFVGTAGAIFLSAPLQQPRFVWVAVAKLSSLPEDGQPQLVRIYVPHQDAWTRLADELAGAVFLRRTANAEGIVALQSFHSHLQIMVEYDKSKRQFHSTCWRVSFDLDGKVVDTALPRVENIESLPAKIVDDQVLIQLSTGWPSGH